MTVTRPFCLVDPHIFKDAAKAGVLCFISFTFCNNNISCSLRLNKRIYNWIHSSEFYLQELAVMINLHNFDLEEVWFEPGAARLKSFALPLWPSDWRMACLITPKLKLHIIQAKMQGNVSKNLNLKLQTLILGTKKAPYDHCQSM